MYVSEENSAYEEMVLLLKNAHCNLKMLTLVESNWDGTFRASDLLFNIKFYVRCNFVLTSKPSFVRGFVNAE